MWCSSCQQDVPGITSPNGVSAVGCARCGSSLGSEQGRRSEIDFVELESAPAYRCTVGRNSEKLSESSNASSRLEWERFEWDANLPHPDLVLHELPELQPGKGQFPTASETRTPIGQTAAAWRNASDKHWSSRGLMQRRVGWCFIAWGLGSGAPCGLWAMWFYAQNDSLWMLAALTAVVSLLVLLFGLILVLHAQARQVEAIAGILQFFVREVAELRPGGMGLIEDAPPCGLQDPEMHHQNRAA